MRLETGNEGSVLNGAVEFTDLHQTSGYFKYKCSKSDSPGRLGVDRFIAVVFSWILTLFKVLVNLSGKLLLAGTIGLGAISGAAGVGSIACATLILTCFQISL
jgi:hypothetical protein